MAATERGRDDEKLVQEKKSPFKSYKSDTQAILLSR